MALGVLDKAVDPPQARHDRDARRVGSTATRKHNAPADRTSGLVLAVLLVARCIRVYCKVRNIEQRDRGAGSILEYQRKGHAVIENLALLARNTRAAMRSAEVSRVACGRTIGAFVQARSPRCL